MEIERVLGIGIIGAVLAITVKNQRPEIGIAVSAVTGIIIFMLISPWLSETVRRITAFSERYGLGSDSLKTVIKIIGIAYVTQFAAELCRDMGEGAIGKKLELAGRAAVLVLMLPIVENLLEVIASALTSF